MAQTLFFFGSFKLDLLLFDPVPGHSVFSDIGGSPDHGIFELFVL